MKISLERFLLVYFQKEFHRKFYTRFFGCFSAEKFENSSRINSIKHSSRKNCFDYFTNRNFSQNICKKNSFEDFAREMYLDLLQIFLNIVFFQEKWFRLILRSNCLSNCSRKNFFRDFLQVNFYEYFLKRNALGNFPEIYFLGNTYL